jgi:hypothetical protein
MYMYVSFGNVLNIMRFVLLFAWLWLNLTETRKRMRDTVLGLLTMVSCFSFV